MYYYYYFAIILSSSELKTSISENENYDEENVDNSLALVPVSSPMIS